MAADPDRCSAEPAEDAKPPEPDGSDRGRQAATGFSAIAPFAGRHVLLFAAHPDDEVLGAGGQFCSLRRLSVVHLTEGVSSHREAWRRGWPTRGAYARARRGEAIAAARLCGTPFDYASLKCRDRAATFEMAEAALRLVGVIRDCAPDLVLSHSYEGGHPDHDAAAFVARSACRLAGEVPLWEMALYHAAGAHPGGADGATDRRGKSQITTGGFLGPPDAIPPAIAVRLSSLAFDRKRRMMACFVSQRRILDEFGADLSIERFRLAPDYDFNEPPHAGILCYETQPWLRMTGVRWRSAAAKAQAEIERSALATGAGAKFAVVRSKPVRPFGGPL